MQKYLGYIIIGLFFISCQSGNIYKEELEIEKGVWHFDDAIRFAFEAPDTIHQYELILQVDHDKEFSYENFYTEIETLFPSKRSAKEAISIQLANKVGSWLGSCGGRSCSAEIELQKSFRFKEVGAHEIIFRNYSREVLEGIEAMSLEINKLP